MRTTHKVYLAGPGVFRPDAEAHARRLSEICRAHGLEPLIPLDVIVDWTGKSKAQVASALYRANLDLIERADGVLADLSPFRGPSADPGTGFEMGVAVARKIPCVGYGVTNELVERVPVCAQSGLDAQGYRVEDLGLADNLMLCMAVGGQVFPDFESAAAHLAAVFKG